MKQHKLDSLMESVTNTFVGFVLSFFVWSLVSHLYGMPMSIGENLQITGIFTIVSIARQYVLRRLFDGKTIWQTIKAKLA